MPLIYIYICFRVHAMCFDCVCTFVWIRIRVCMEEKERENEIHLLPHIPSLPARLCCCSCVGFRGHRSRYPPPPRTVAPRIILKCFSTSRFGEYSRVSRSFQFLFIILDCLNLLSLQFTSYHGHTYSFIFENLHDFG